MTCGVRGRVTSDHPSLPKVRPSGTTAPAAAARRALAGCGAGGDELLGRRPFGAAPGTVGAVSSRSSGLSNLSAASPRAPDFTWTQDRGPAALVPWLRFLRDRGA